ncbi:hypothetical protein A3F55_00340 [Candidatus Adlerbacteria bacterium RIFCSPHIGHO2_12_FULL_53_18]|uniref:Uncharacterized protein n=1 Tax=Candidatus Adlerbacteria bacterium RIFCSPHIGHO2_12_FULL_53_18 TaxID=1797242 RepID=A0A1F4XS25_9BACT|nr:MAG: hypothetical protein A3F55_00340 [Candidatus Adlerbacteria bacterium RIFCSPHIGHO2_12_FULL_53_18]
MQIQSAVAVDDKATGSGAELIFKGDSINQILPHLKPGSRLEVKFPKNYKPRHLDILMDLSRSSAIELDHGCVRFVTAERTSIDVNRRQNVPVSFVLRDEFFRWKGRQSRFLAGLCPKLEYVKLLPA